jgi:hypothetical protein
MKWNFEDLWNKAKLYIERGLESDRESDLFPFWNSLGLELLARATLAKIHPALLADPQQGENILYACGFPGRKPPKSVPIKTVFHRLTVIVPEFTESDFKFATSLMEVRNAELHSGELAFDNYPSKLWFPEFLRICNILVKYNGKILEELLGEKDAKAALDTISALESKKVKDVNNLIALKKKEFDVLDVEVRLEKVKESKVLVSQNKWGNKKVRKCPACGTEGLLSGEVVKYLRPQVDEDFIREKAVIIPTKFNCFSCSLKLDTHEQVYIADMGDQFTLEGFRDPQDYYGIDFESEEYADFDDYGND